MTRRRGTGGRVSDKTMQEGYALYESLHITCPQDLTIRLEKFCEEEERAKSWVIQKALDKWLAEKGY